MLPSTHMSATRARVGLALTLLAGACSLACAAKLQESEMRAVWLPRDDSKGFVVDEASSDVRDVYLKRPHEEGASAAAGEDAASARR